MSGIAFVAGKKRKRVGEGWETSVHGFFSELSLRGMSLDKKNSHFHYNVTGYGSI